MICKLVKKDLSRNRAVTLAILLFITIAALFLSLASVLTGSLFGSVNRLMETAKTPHFMQMHSGDLNIEQLEDFAAKNSSVLSFQVMNFLNIDSDRIIIGETSLAGNLQDNGLCVQSEAFDFLLDFDNHPVRPEPGEIYVPVCYLKDGTAKTGDPALIDGIPFTVAGFVRDSQMNSTLASSKRFLINANDYARLSPLGKEEYLIEFRLKDLSALSRFEAEYSAACLPANGPALTWPLFQMVSAISDGIMIALILIVGFLMILIALMCIRFTLLAKIEEDYREIGVMKAVGIRVSDIRNIYLAAYAVITASGSTAGFFLSLLLYRPMSESIRLNFGESGIRLLSFVLPGIFCIILMDFFILFSVARILRRFRRISASQALRFGMEEESTGCTGMIRLSKNGWIPINILLGMKDILSRKRLYATMLAVIILAVFIVSVPQNLYYTISGENFITYMGIGRCDLRMDIQQNSRIDEKTSNIRTVLEADSSISKYTALTTKTFSVKLKSGLTENMKIELGDHTVFPIPCSSGRLPESDQEIALSSMNAKELEMCVGDRLTLLTADGEKELTVSGIYSDITNGGKTAKAVFSADSARTAWTVICADLVDSRRLKSKQDEYSNRFDYAKVSDVKEYTAQTLGQTLRSVHSAAVTSTAAAALVTLLVVLLFLKLLIIKDRRSISIMKAVGFTDQDIFFQYLWRTILLTAAGVILGTVLVKTVGEKLAASAIASIGADNFHFAANPVFSGFICPFIMFLSTLAAIPAGISGLYHADLLQSLKE